MLQLPKKSKATIHPALLYPAARGPPSTRCCPCVSAHSLYTSAHTYLHKLCLCLHAKHTLRSLCVQHTHTHTHTISLNACTPLCPQPFYMCARMHPYILHPWTLTHCSPQSIHTPALCTSPYSLLSLHILVQFLNAHTTSVHTRKDSRQPTRSLHPSLTLSLPLTRTHSFILSLHCLLPPPCASPCGGLRMGAGRSIQAIQGAFCQYPPPGIYMRGGGVRGQGGGYWGNL
ncbi:hypothetical protein FKM82_021593 [Ascaphus truei]